MTLNNLRLKAAVRFRKSLEDAKLTDWITAISTVCITLVAIIAALISFFQWREMHAGGADTHDLAVAAKTQADANKAEADAMKNLADRALRQAEASDKLAGDAATSADAAMRTAKDADISARATASMAATSAASLSDEQANAQLDQRAWLAVTGLRLSRFKADDTVQAQVTLVNSGRSPALHTQIVVFINLMDIGVEPPFLNLPPLSSVIGLRAVTPQAVNTSTKDSDFRLTEEEKERVGRFSRVLWVWGYVHYDDTFGKRHLSQFCGFTRSDGVRSAKITEGMDLYLCPQNNDMD